MVSLLRKGKGDRHRVRYAGPFLVLSAEVCA